MINRVSRSDGRGRRSPWIVWAVAVGVYFLAILHRASLGVAGPQAIARLDISATELGAFLMLQLGLYALMQVPSGLALDRWGPRRVLLVATLVMGSAQILFAVATNYPMALIARALLGAGDAAVFIAVLRLAATWFPHRRYAVLTMLTGLVGMAGNLAATVPLVLMLGSLGWTTTFAVTGATSLAYALLLLRPAVAEPYRQSHAAPQEREPAARPARRSMRSTVAAAWRRRETRLGFWTHQATMTPGVVISLVWGFPYLTEALGYSDAAAASQLSIYVIATAVASLFIPPLAGRRPAWRTAIAAGVAVAGIGAIVVLAFWPGGHPPGAVVTAMFAVLAMGAPASQIGFHLARDYNPRSGMSTATGLVNTGGFGGSMLVAIIVGVVLDASSGGSVPGLTDYRWAFAAFAAFVGLSTLAMLASLLGVRASVLDRMARGEQVIVPATPHWWDRAYRRLTDR